MSQGLPDRFTSLTDYILAITHEIWESRQIDRIARYYSADCVIYTLGGIVIGADAVDKNTRDTLRAFPDRLLLGEAVVLSPLDDGCWLSSHRIGSPMTHMADLPQIPATGRKVFVRTIADCVVDQGVITREWLVRDNYSLMQQLQVDPIAAARSARTVSRPELLDWLASEKKRIDAAPDPASEVLFADAQRREFAMSVLWNEWIRGDRGLMGWQFADYAVVHDSMPIASGIEGIHHHYAGLRAAISDAALTVDSVGWQPSDGRSGTLAARWMLSFRHTGRLWGLEPSGAPAVMMGVTHWQILDGKIVAEWAIYDRVATLAQLVDASE